MSWRSFFCVGVGMLCTAPGWAWQIEPLTTPTDQTLVRRIGFWKRIPILLGDTIDRLVGAPMHEAFILRTLGCNLDNPSDCFKERSTLAPQFEALFAGVQWNDNPPFSLSKSGFTYKDGEQAAISCLGDTIRLPRHPDCWAKAIRDAEAVAADTYIDSSYPILYRSHYGDLQFLHAMSSGNDTAQQTQAKMMIWAEFAYKVARGDIQTTMALDKVPVDGFPPLIGIKERTIESLLTLGDPAFRSQPMINWFAMGTLVHMVQDTFSAAHAERGEEGGVCDTAPEFRQPGLLQHFHAYDQQDSGKHKVADSRDAFVSHELTVGNGAVQATNNLLKLYQSRADWPQMKNYLMCIFRIGADFAQATGDAGAGFEK